MFYVTIKLPPMYHQITLEEFLYEDNLKYLVNSNETNTRTYKVECINPKLKSSINLRVMLDALNKFNESTQHLRVQERSSLYKTFYIPKSSGGLRRIDAPQPELMGALRDLKAILENQFNAIYMYHTSAFAYIKGRSTLDAVKKHQNNESKWFAKYDLSNFFGNTTLEYVLKMFSMVFPFSELMEIPDGKAALTTALELAFLNGGLPQGTPISPLITNIMMIPIDYKLANELRDYNHQHYIYTRYADDFLVSSKYSFNFKKIEGFIKETLKEFEAPFELNSKKTRYGSSAGSNWNLGVMLNKDNQITVGYKKIREFKSMLTSYIKDKQNGKEWTINDVQVLEGYRTYYHMVEAETIDKIVDYIDNKFGSDVRAMIKEDLRR